MTQTLKPKNIEAAIKDLFQTVDSEDWETMKAYYHPEIIYERPGYDPIIGIAPLLHYYKEVRVLGSGSHHIEGVIYQGNQVAYWGNFKGTKKDGTPVDVRFSDICTMDNGQIRQRTTFFFKPDV